ncbi:MAG: hypothetical protein JXA09_05250 [Anaerolineae bacterium]|nr:hypothetical protein [Anaerolineae bacterium]
MTEQWEPSVGQLRIVGGVPQDPPRNLGMMERRPILSTRSRSKGQLFTLVELTGETFDQEEICAELVATILDAYFETRGTVTYGLRQAILLANMRLRQINERLISGHHHGGVACIVLRDGEVFIAQAGWPMVYLIKGDRVLAYPDDELTLEEAGVLGERQTVDVRLHQATLQPGDTVLAVDGPMARQLGSTRIGQIVAGGVTQAIRNLHALAPHEDSTALVIQVGVSEEQAAAREQQWTFTPVEPPAPRAEEQAEPAPAAYETAPREAETPVPAAEQLARAVPVTEPRRPGRAPARAQSEAPDRTPTPEPRSTAPLPGVSPVTRAGPTVGERARAFLTTALGALRIAGKSLLPDRPPPSPAQRRAKRGTGKRRPIQRLNLAIGIAIAIPVTALIIVGAYRTYQDWSTRSQFTKALDEANQTRDLALRSTADPSLAREYWLQTIERAKEAGALQADVQEVQLLLQQAATAIDQIDQITRLDAPFKIYDYTLAGSAPSRVIASGLDVYVLDRGLGRVYYHALNETRTALRDQDSSRVLIEEAQPVNGQTLGPLIDMTWLPEGGDRQSGSLLLIDRNALVVEFDPAWEQRNTVLLGGKDVWRAPVAAKTFDGNLYLLDTVANQIFRYNEGQYEGAPVSWIQGEFDASGAIDLGIDGSIYVISESATITKLFAGEPTPFEVSGVPQPMLNANALYLEVEETARHIYVADATELRIVQLARDGSFVRQFRLPAEQEMLFSGLSGIFVDEPGGKLFFLAANALYVVELPPVPV